MNSVRSVNPTVEFTAVPTGNAAVLMHEFALSGRDVGHMRGSLFIVAPGGRTEMDCHAVHELWLVVSGSGQLRCNGELFALTPQTVYCIEPFWQHEAINNGPEPLIAYSVWWP